MVMKFHWSLVRLRLVRCFFGRGCGAILPCSCPYSPAAVANVALLGARAHHVEPFRELGFAVRQWRPRHFSSSHTDAQIPGVRGLPDVPWPGAILHHQCAYRLLHWGFLAVRGLIEAARRLDQAVLDHGWREATTAC